MKMKDKRTRRSAIAFAAVAAVAAGGVSTAIGASAAATLTLYPGVTAITTLATAPAADANNTSALDFQLSAAASDGSLEAATFAVRQTTATANVRIKLTSAPSGTAPVYAVNTANTAGTVPVNTDNWWIAHTHAAALTTGTYSESDLLSNPTGRVYFAFKTAGTYKALFFEDVNGNGVYDSGDSTSPEMTFTVLDPAGATSGYNWTPPVSAPASVINGAPVPLTVGLSDLTLTDARGTSSGIPLYVTALAAKLTLAADLAAGSTYATTLTNVVGRSTVTGVATAGASQVNTRVRMALAAATTVGSAPATATSIVAGTYTDATSVTATDVTGAVKSSGSAVSVDSGTKTVAYTAGSSLSNNNIVYWKLKPTMNASTTSLTCPSALPTVTADGTLVAAYGDGSKLYTSTVSGSTASLAVTSTDTTGGCAGYTVSADAANSTLVTTSYVTDTPTALSVANTSSELLVPAALNPVTFKASLVNAAGKVVAPLSGDTQTATVTIGGNTYSSTVSGKVFSYAYTPSTTPSGTTTGAWSYGTGTNTACSTACTVTATVTWTTTAKAGTITLSSPTTSSHAVADASATPSGAGVVVTGTVVDASGSPLVNKKITLSGGGVGGVYFSTSNSAGAALSSTLDVLTSAGGQLGTAYVFYTKVGDVVVKAAADDAKAEVTVPVTALTSGAGKHIVSNDDTFGISGAGAITMKGKVTDAFGNPVSGAYVFGELDSTTYGDFTSTPIATSSSTGAYTLSFTPVSGAKGVTSVTSYLSSTNNVNGSGKLTAVPTVNSLWASLGVTGLPVGQYKDVAKITVGPIVLSGPASRVGAGTITLEGVSSPNSVVIIKARTAGSSAGLVDVDTVTADANGDFSSVQYITGATTFVATTTANSTTLYSPSILVATNASAGGGGGTPATKVVCTGAAKAMGKGKVTISVAATPAKATLIRLYVLSGKKYVLLKTWQSTSAGKGSITVKSSRGTKSFRIILSQAGKTSGVKDIKVTVK